MEYSNSDYRKLGDRIRQDVSNISDSDYEMLQQLRISYKPALATIYNSLETLAHKVDGHCVCTYRIKRIESIISKLCRFPKMVVNRAEDIAGCRCILSTEDGVYRLYKLIIAKQNNLPFEIKGTIHDYIAEPKESGYKSIHLNVTLKGDNRRIEIQLRSLEQHNWATLVEITDLLYDLRLKEIGAKSNDELFKLHYLLAQSPQKTSLKSINYVADTIIKYGYVQKLGTVFAKNYIDVRKHWNSLKLQKSHFFLISTGKDGIPEIMGFSDFDKAEAEYYDKFINNKSNKNIVLTHLRDTNFAKISVAYSNYFLTFNNTIVRILLYLSRAVEESYKKNKYKTFARYYQAFLDIMLFWKEKQVVEINSYNKDHNIKKSRAKKQDWEYTIYYCINAFNGIFKTTHNSMKFNLKNIISYIIMTSKFRKYQQSANVIIVDRH